MNTDKTDKNAVNKLRASHELPALHSEVTRLESGKLGLLARELTATSNLAGTARIRERLTLGFFGV